MNCHDITEVKALRERLARTAEIGIISTAQSHADIQAVVKLIDTIDQITKIEEILIAVSWLPYPRSAPAKHELVVVVSHCGDLSYDWIEAKHDLGCDWNGFNRDDVRGWMPIELFNQCATPAQKQDLGKPRTHDLQYVSNLKAQHERN